MASEPEHVVVPSRIVAEVELIDGDAALPEARFDYWAQLLGRKYPRAQHGALYGKLVTMSFEFAKRRALAALQLFALGTLGLAAARAHKLAGADSFLHTPGAKKLRQQATRNAAQGPMGAMAAPTAAGASSQRLHPSQKKKQTPSQAYRRKK